MTTIQINAKIPKTNVYLLIEVNENDAALIIPLTVQDVQGRGKESVKSRENKRNYRRKLKEHCRG